MRLFVILFLLGSCTANTPSEEHCLSWLHDVCHCKENSNKTIWSPEPTNWEKIAKVCK